MAKVNTLEELIVHMTDASRRLGAARTILTIAKTKRQNKIKGGDHPEDIDTSMVAQLTDIEDIADLVGTDLGTIIYANAIVCPVGCPATYTSAAIVVASQATITGNAGIPFKDGAGQLFANGDVVELSRCEDSDTNGEYTVDSCATNGDTSVLTFAAGIGGANNPTDKTIVITLKER